MTSGQMRKPAVAGQFYPADAEELRAQIREFTDIGSTRISAWGCLLPHAGYIYSGQVAGMTVAQLTVKDTVVILGPNHTGLGTEFSCMAHGTWRTPLGDVTINAPFAQRLCATCPAVTEDTLAHLHEHSIEVELPFLQYHRPDFSLVPIAIASQNLARLRAVGTAIADCAIAHGTQGSTLIVASSDMSHYEPQRQAKRKDTLAIEALLALDEERLIETVQTNGISMCGVAPAVAMLAAVKKLGAGKAKLVAYQTSGDRTGDTSSVVGYAGLLFY